MEDIFANYISDKWLMSKIYKEIIQLNSKNTPIWFKNGPIWIDIFPKHTNRWPKVHEMMFSIINNQRNANQTHNKVSPHTYQNGYYQKEKKQVLVRMWRKGNPFMCTGVGNVNIWNGAATMENSMEVPHKIKNRTTTWSSNYTSGYFSKENKH